MLKVKFNRIGGSFSHAQSSTLWKVPKTLEYVENGLLAENTIYIDKIRFNLHYSDTTFGWLHESKSIIPEEYYRAEYLCGFYKSQYKYIFTHDQLLINRIPELFKFVPACGYWIEELKEKIEKTKLVSMITSNKQMCEGHLNRLRWMERLKGQVDLFGRGINQIEKKEEGLEPYYFSIAIENGKYDTYFTEKILDCFATQTIPVYYGTEKIVDYFNKDGIIFLTDDFKVEDLSYELYLSKFDAVVDNFNRVKEYYTVEDWMVKKYFNEIPA
jgi:hypothetical protein